MERSQVAPTVSVIIPSYNHEQYVAETLRSLEAQSFQDFEIIVVDDGSTDRTVEVIKDTFSRAQLHTQPNRGVVAARNRGVSLSQGKYLCFVDSDDVLMPQCLQRQVAVLEADPQVVLTFADAVIIDADGAVAISFDGDAPGQVVVLLLAEQLSDAAFDELNAAIAGGN